ncbi:MAG: leucine-rich repeat domain-containing protein, partial [Muribaculaceae bacterium]|nr:leucine-rich repeat domain-containing protein [Muribaculaceae bacterium]
FHPQNAIVMKKAILFILFLCSILCASAQTELPFKIGTSINDVPVSPNITADFFIYEIPEYTVDNFGIKFKSNPKAYLGSFKRVHDSDNDSVIIPSSVTLSGYQITVDSIGKRCTTDGWVKISHIAIPQTFTRIPREAFIYDRYLKSIDIPESVKYIDYEAFYSTKLSQIDLTHVEYIGERAFSGATLPTINLPSVKIIKKNAFHNAEIDSILLYNTLTDIGPYAFYKSKIKKTLSINIPASVNKIYAYAFSQSSITEVTFNNIPVLGESVFEDCTSLERVIFPAEFDRIPNRTFRNCTALHYVLFPTKLYHEIGEYAFYGCTSMRGIRTIPDGTIEVMRSAFEGCSKINEIILPASLKSIGNYAFYNCSRLEKIQLPSDLNTMGIGAFWRCRLLTSIKIPEGITKIANQAFYGCEYLTSVELPSSLTAIGSEVFKNCSNLKHIMIPDSVTNIDYGVFSGCSSLSSIELPKALKKVCKNLFYGCKNLRDIKCNAPYPPDIDANNDYSSFVNDFAPRDVYDFAILHIPPYSLYSYLRAAVWKEFNHYDDPYTGITDIESDSSGPEIVTSADGVTITGADGMPVNAYTADGRLMFSSPAYDGSALPLPHGSLYIITIGPKHIKVML